MKQFVGFSTADIDMFVEQWKNSVECLLPVFALSLSLFSFPIFEPQNNFLSFSWRQCDQMAKLFSNIYPFATTKICPIFDKVGSIILQITKYTLPETFKILP